MSAQSPEPGSTRGSKAGPSALEGPGPQAAEGAAGYAARIRRLVGAALIANVVLLALATGAVWTLDRAVGDAEHRRARLERSRSTILYLDEVLTMSTRMAASSGEPRWEERYQQHEPLLDAAIVDAESLAGAPGRAAAAAIGASNLALVALEHAAFAHVRAGRRREAVALLDGVAYREGKEAYADGLAAFAAALDRDAADAAARADHYRQLAVFVLLLGAGLGILAWWGFRRALASAEGEYLRAEERARAAARVARLAMEAALLGPFRLEGRQVRLDPHAAALLELEGPRSLELEDLVALAEPTDRERLRGALQDSADSGVPLDVTFARGPRWLLARGAREEEDPSAVHGALVDVTARVEGERALQALAATLEDKVAERSVALERQAADLRSLAQELAAVEQRERRRLADLLHDDVQQILAAARLHFAAAGPSAGLQLLDEAIHATRTLSHELSPPLLDTTLRTALEGLADLFLARHRLEVEVHAEGDPLVPDLVRDVLFGAARELLFNTVKHANVATARIALRAEGAGIHLEVSDPGSGFATDDPREGRGLTGVLDRVVALGGRADLASAPGQGTRITLTVPLPRPG